MVPAAIALTTKSAKTATKATTRLTASDPLGDAEASGIPSARPGHDLGDLQYHVPTPPFLSHPFRRQPVSLFAGNHLCSCHWTAQRRVLFPALSRSITCAVGS